jgi:hypothetical protein
MQTTCKQELPERYIERMVDMQRLLRSMRDNDKEVFNELVLSWEYNQQFKSLTLMLSFGGPADGFQYSPRGRNVKYYFQDWGDYAEKKLTGVDLDTMVALFDYLPQPTI